VHIKPNAFYLSTKRVLDVILGGILFVLSAPIILLAALAMRLDSPGNPFFLQVRVGLRGKRFTIFKLRGMYIDARDRFPDLYAYGQREDLDFYFHYEQDPRITAVGRFLRRTSIDELPNFLNVVLGTMTLVGPRPEIPEVLRLYGECAHRYLSVKPGVTCLSKITGRDLLTKRESVNLDLEYIDKMSLRMDIRILWKTLRNVLLVRLELPKRQECSVAKPPNRHASAPTQTD
jgi:lipopolysaccharide/colanic/teichoic acid biosynthesis glycosyltransferase